jgi:hypothetical protein
VGAGKWRVGAGKWEAGGWEGWEREAGEWGQGAGGNCKLVGADQIGKSHGALLIGTLEIRPTKYYSRSTRPSFQKPVEVSSMHECMN